MIQDISYFEVGYIDESYFVRIANADSAISTSASMSVTIGVIKQAAVAVSGAFNANLVANPIRNDQSVLAVTTTLEATPKRIRDNNVAVSSAFSIATSGSRIRYINAQEDAAFTVSIGNSRVRNNQAAVTAAFSSTLTVRETSGLAANLSTTSSLTATGIRTIRISASAQVQGQIISPTGEILQADLYPNYAKLTLAQPV